jgi:hypothetical protein
LWAPQSKIAVAQDRLGRPNADGQACAAGLRMRPVKLSITHKFDPGKEANFDVYKSG